MRAVIRRGGKLVVDEMAVPEPGPGQLLARTLVCGICGSDLHALDHYDRMIDMTQRLGGIGQMKKGADTVFGVVGSGVWVGVPGTGSGVVVPPG